MLYFISNPDNPIISINSDGSFSIFYVFLKKVNLNIGSFHFAIEFILFSKDTIYEKTPR